MRIGLDFTSAVHQGAGIGRYTRGLVQALSQLHPENEYVLLVSGRPSADALPPSLPGNFRIRYLPLAHRWTTVLWHRLRLPVPADLFIGRVDIFHSPDFVLPPLASGKKILTVHDLSFFRYPQGAEPSLRWYLEGAVPRSVARADLLFADSQCTKKDIVDILRVPEEKVEVVYPGVDPIFQPVEDEAEKKRMKAKYGLHAPFILSVGTIEPRKNFPGLMRGFRILREEHKIPHELVIAGAPGWLYQGIYREVDELRLGGNVLFLGYVPDWELPALYSLAEVFAFPSFYEGFGLPPLEAMACGVPTVVSNVASLPEAVGDGALLVPPEDTEALAEALYGLLSDDALREEMRRKGLERAQRFSWQKTGEEVLAHYRRIARTDV